MPRTQYARPLLGDPLRRLVEDASLEHESSEHEHEQPSPHSLRVGAVDDREELDADRVADQVLARLAGHDAVESESHEHEGDEHDVRRTPGAGAVVGAAGGDLDTSSSAAIEGARGGGSALPAGVRREMEAGFGHSLSDVRIHTDERAAGLSRQMSARAFTTGRDIFFDKGEFSPGTAEGKRVLAHEIAHTRQDAGVRRKLRGTSSALLAQGEVGGDGGRSSGKLRKLVGSVTNWDKLVGSVQAYEAEESRLLASGKNPDPLTLASAKPGMLKMLTKVQQYIADWRKANPTVEPVDKAPKKGQRHKELKEDPRSKAQRRQAVAMLEPRVGHEIRLLSAKDGAEWLSGLGLSTGQVTKTGESDSGEKNTVSQIDYQSENGSMSGFFKQEKGFNHDREGHERNSGIKQVDPNYGARNIALYRLDRLLDAGVIARAEFAVHTDGDGKSTLGTVMEKAKGGKFGGHMVRHTDDGAVGGVGLNDPKLLSGLNKLQLLDAIAGQLDRHLGNFFVDTDEKGNVTSVTGIDNDMAFGEKMLSPNDDVGAHHYRGIPEYVDKVMGEKILAVRESDIRDALAGLLSQSEIDATVSRFLVVQQAVKIAARAGRLEEKWDESSAKRGISKVSDTKFSSTTKSYQDSAKGSFVLASRIGPFVRDEGERAMREHRFWSDLPDQLTQAFHAAFNYEYEINPVLDMTRQQTLTHILSERSTRAVARALIEHCLDQMNADKWAIEVMEMSNTPEDTAELTKKLAVAITEVYTKLGNEGMKAICAKVLGKA